MLGESIRVPYRADDWIGTILVGSVLTLLAGLLVVGWLFVLAVSLPVGAATALLVVLPSLVLRGYLLGVVRSGLGDKPTVDSFVHWGTLVRDGSRSTLISAIYLLPAAVFFGLAVGGGAATVIDPEGFEGPLQALAALVILVGGFGTLIYGLVYLYIRPAARAVFAATGSVRAALGVRRVLGVSASGDYITGWLIGMGILVVGPLVTMPLLVGSLLVGLVSPALAFVGILATILAGICLLFVCRVSAAWATGRGSAERLIELVPAVERDDHQPRPPVVPEAAFSEGSGAVQTGRTVPFDNGSTPDDKAVLPTPLTAGLPAPLREGDLSGAPVYPRQLGDGPRLPGNAPSSADENGDAVETSADHTGDDTNSSADGDTEFIWGPDDE